MSEESSKPLETSKEDPKERFERLVEMSVSSERATFMIKSAIIKDGLVITRSDIETKLKQIKVTHGLRLNVIDEVLSKKLYDIPHVVAVQLLPVEGNHASIDEKIKVAGDAKPVVMEDGHADYKNIDNIHQAKSGTVLAVKTPMLAGTDGYDVYGKTIAAKPVSDAQLMAGLNTVISPDGLQLIAQKGGYLYYDKGFVCIGETYVVKGDVGFKTGNIRYHGSIQIQGNVADDFIVEADGDVIIEGNVDAAKIISHEGSIEIKQAFFGHGKAKLKAAKNIKVISVQDAQMEAGEIVEVVKSMCNCTVICDEFQGARAGCIVFGGSIKAYKNIFLAAVGCEGNRTDLKVVDKETEVFRLRLVEVNIEHGKYDQVYEPLDKKFRSMAAMAKKFGANVPPKAQVELKTLATQCAAVKKKLEQLEQEKIELTTKVKSTKALSGKVAVTERVIWGTHLELYNLNKELGAEDIKKQLTWSHEGIAALSLPGA